MSVPTEILTCLNKRALSYKRPTYTLTTVEAAYRLVLVLLCNDLKGKCVTESDVSSIRDDLLSGVYDAYSLYIEVDLADYTLNISPMELYVFTELYLKENKIIRKVPVRSAIKLFTVLEPK